MTTFRTKIAGMLAVSTAIIAASCNKADTPLPGYEPDASVMVTGFSLKENKKVLENLDSVFFSIDLDKGVIFNADSLPFGTDVSRLIPVISYPSSCSGAVITMEGGDVREGEVDYKKHPGDSIDFTGNVTLRLTSSVGNSSRIYRLKVNVHRLVADSLQWQRTSVSKLPARLAQPKEQKTVTRADIAYTLVAESDGTFTMASSAAPQTEGWQTSVLNAGFTPDVRSFVAGSDAFYMLDTQGTLYTSPDALTWTSTSQTWRSIIGGFADCVLGLADIDGVLTHVSYPAKYPQTAAAPDFPVADSSNLGLFESKWSENPIAILVGGTADNGSNVVATWSFDGENWVKLSSFDMCGTSRAMLVPYYVYRKAATSWHRTEYAIWLLLGGLADGKTPSNTVWLSYDNGVNWQKAPDSMQMPAEMPALAGADGVILSTEMHADLQDAWTRGMLRLPYTQEGYNIIWQCPYIYIFGGYADGVFNTDVWRGVLHRLSFTPLL